MHELWGEVEVLVIGDWRFGTQLEVTEDLKFGEFSTCADKVCNGIQWRVPKSDHCLGWHSAQVGESGMVLYEYQDKELFDGDLLVGCGSPTIPQALGFCSRLRSCHHAHMASGRRLV